MGDGGGEILNDVDVIDLHAKIEMKGTSRRSGWRGGGRAKIGEGPLGIDNCATHKKRAGISKGELTAPERDADAIQFKGRRDHSMDGWMESRRGNMDVGVHQIETSNK